MVIYLFGMVLVLFLFKTRGRCWDGFLDFCFFDEGFLWGGKVLRVLLLFVFLAVVLIVFGVMFFLDGFDGVVCRESVGWNDFLGGFDRFFCGKIMLGGLGGVFFGVTCWWSSGGSLMSYLL